MSLENGSGGSENMEERYREIDRENRKPDIKDIAKAEFEIKLKELERKEKINKKNILSGTHTSATMFAEAAIEMKNNAS